MKDKKIEKNNYSKHPFEFDSTETRKIQKVGERSYSISLPKEWVKRNNLKEKDFVFMDIDSNQIIIKSSRGRFLEERNIAIGLEKVSEIKEFVTLCYIRGVNKIKITSSTKFLPEEREEIEEIVAFLKGYETINESEKEIEISFLFNEIKVTIDSLVKRMISIIRFMVDALKDRDGESLTKLEHKLDQIFHLSRRILFSSSRDPIKQSKNNLKDIQEIFFYMESVRKLERLGDDIYRLREVEVSEEDLEHLEEVIVKFSNSFLKKNPKVKFRVRSKNPVTDKIFLKINHDLKDMSKILTSINYNREFFPAN